MDFLARRLATQGVSDPHFRRPVDVVKSLGAVQAQDYLGALWAIGLRMAKGTEADVERAIANRSIVRSWPMRRTLHFVAAADLRWMLALLGPRSMRLLEKWLKDHFSIDAAVLRASRKAAIAALRDGRCLTRDVLYQRFDDAGIETADGRGLHLVWALANEGLLCFAAREGKQQAFTLLEEWLPDTHVLPRDEALATLAHRYFSGHGPATHRDFAWWSGLTAADAKRGLEAAQPGLKLEAGSWMLASDDSSLKRPASSRVVLLPAWDEYTVGYADRSALVDAAHLRKLDPRYGVLNAVMVRDGRVFGSWKRVIRPGQVLIKPEPFARLVKAEQKALGPAIRRYGVFLGLPAAVASSRGLRARSRQTRP